MPQLQGCADGAVGAGTFQPGAAWRSRRVAIALPCRAAYLHCLAVQSGAERAAGQGRQQAVSSGSKLYAPVWALHPGVQRRASLYGAQGGLVDAQPHLGQLGQLAGARGSVADERFTWAQHIAPRCLDCPPDLVHCNSSRHNARQSVIHTSSCMRSKGWARQLAPRRWVMHTHAGMQQPAWAGLKFHKCCAAVQRAGVCPTRCRAAD